MTPKEKAIQLFKKFDSLLVALYVCEEMRKQMDSLSIPVEFSHPVDYYWSCVEDELKLM